MEAMFFGYNIILHLPITVLNYVICSKEIFMEIFQMSAKKHGHEGDLALGLLDIADFFKTLLKVLNPMNYFEFIKKEFYTKLYKKYVMK